MLPSSYLAVVFTCLATTASAGIFSFECAQNSFKIDTESMMLSINSSPAQPPEVRWDGAWFEFSTPESIKSLFNPRTATLAHYGSSATTSCRITSTLDLRGLPFPEYPVAQSVFDRMPENTRVHIQNFLATVGYYAGDNDAQWGPGMRRAISDYIVSKRLMGRPADLMSTIGVEAAYQEIQQKEFLVGRTDEIDWGECDGCETVQETAIGQETAQQSVSERTSVASAESRHARPVMDAETRERETATAIEACKGKETMFGLCWEQSPAQKTLILQQRGFAPNETQDGFVGPDDATVTIDENVMRFNCDVFRVCDMMPTELIKIFSEEYDVVDGFMHSSSNLFGQTYGPCAVLGSGEQICVVESFFDGELGQLQALGGQKVINILFKKGSFEEPRPTFR